ASLLLRRIRPFLPSRSKVSGWVLSRAVASLVSQSVLADLQRVILSGRQTSFLAVSTSACAKAGGAAAAARPAAKARKAGTLRRMDLALCCLRMTAGSAPPGAPSEEFAGKQL